MKQKKIQKFHVHYTYCIDEVTHYSTEEAPRAPGVCGSQDFQTIDIWMWYGSQTYASTVFTSKEGPWQAFIRG
jgi:hypothetical protein